MTALLLCSWCCNRSQEDILAEAQHLLDAGYYQISRHYQMLARLPEGKNAHQALSAAVAKARDLPGCQEPILSGADVQWIHLSTKAEAGDHYLRVYAPKEDRVAVACHRVFAAFRALGGRTYLARHHVASERLHAPRSHDLAP